MLSINNVTKGKTMRLIQDIQNEYVQLCSQLGEAIHKAEVEIPALIHDLKNKISNLKIEHADVSKALAEAQVVAEDVKKAADIAVEVAAVVAEVKSI